MLIAGEHNEHGDSYTDFIMEFTRPEIYAFFATTSNSNFHVLMQPLQNPIKSEHFLTIKNSRKEKYVN